MQRNLIETVLGALVLALAALFLHFAYSSSDLQKVEGYNLTANFPRVDGLKEGSDVRVNGVKVGSIANMNLITTTGADEYLVRVTLSVNDKVKLPIDTVAMAASESLLGGKYLSLEIGVDDQIIPQDGTGKITRTQAPLRLDDIIGQVMYGSTKKSESVTPAPALPAPTPAATPVAMPAVPAHP